VFRYGPSAHRIAWKWCQRRAGGRNVGATLETDSEEVFGLARTLGRTDNWAAEICPWGSATQPRERDYRNASRPPQGASSECHRIRMWLKSTCLGLAFGLSAAWNTTKCHFLIFVSLWQRAEQQEVTSVRTLEGDLHPWWLVSRPPFGEAIENWENNAVKAHIRPSDPMLQWR